LSLFLFFIALALVIPKGRAFLDKYPRHHFHHNEHNGHPEPRHFTFPTIATALIALYSTFLFIIDLSIELAIASSVKSAVGFNTDVGLQVSRSNLTAA
jgi:hypothetical protein